MKTHEQKAVGHTAGPWDYFKHADNSISIMGDTDGADLHVATMLYTGFPEAVEANARLISQAPAMLDALEKCVEALELSRCYWHAERAGKKLIEFCPDLVAFEKALKASRAIIARAKGEA